MKRVKPFCWATYSKRAEKLLVYPKGLGSIPSEANAPGELRRSAAESGSMEKGNWVKLYLLVDESDGVIVDMKYQAFGETPLIMALEALRELCLHKNYVQAGRVTAELIEKNLELKEGFAHTNLALEALEEALPAFSDIYVEEASYTTPLDLSALEKGEYPNWPSLSYEGKIEAIQAVLEKEIQPYVELDGGGVSVKAMRDDLTVLIEYAGNCTTCYSSTSSTLSAIQEVLRLKIHPELTVVPVL